jgi:hypothetical protein
LLGIHFVVAGAPKTYVLLYTSPSCRYSVAAALFHRKVLETARSAGLSVLVAVRQPEDVAQYRKTGEFPGVRFILGRTLPVEPAGTPTILLVRNDHVERAWNGFQKTEQQRTDVLETIAATNSGAD